MNETALDNNEDNLGWYIEFQAAILRQIPRPGDIKKDTGIAWTKNQAALSQSLSHCLLKNPESRLTLKWCGSITETPIRDTSKKLFVPEEYFILMDQKNIAKIAYMDDEFKERFINGASAEPRTSSYSITILETNITSTAENVLSLLKKDKRNLEMRLIDLYSALMCGLGPKRTNMFRIRDKNGIFATIFLIRQESQEGYHITLQPENKSIVLDKGSLIYTRQRKKTIV